MAEIAFDDERQYVGRRESVIFMATVDAKRVPCIIPRKALSDCFGAGNDPHKRRDECLAAFDHNRDAIRAAAVRMLNSIEGFDGVTAIVLQSEFL